MTWKIFHYNKGMILLLLPPLLAPSQKGKNIDFEKTLIYSSTLFNGQREIIFLKLH